MSPMLADRKRGRGARISTAARGADLFHPAIGGTGLLEQVRVRLDDVEAGTQRGR